ncbi:MAG: nucleoside monophosphate kinase [Lentisphaeria bacterium]|nr:nucleoside monophosphate kinase [Lentisphaeria bacterium]
MMANYVFLGAPGVGKGTMSAFLCARTGVVHVSTGDMLREELASGTELGASIQVCMAAGELVSDALVSQLVRKRLACEDVIAAGFLLDGYPRTVPQARNLRVVLEEYGLSLDWVVLIEAQEEALTSRLVSRRVCRQCKAVYNILTKPPKKAGVCDACGGELVQRGDDTLETVAERLAVYHRSTAPLIEFYEECGLLVRTTGELSPAENFVELCRGIDLPVDNV